MTNLPHARNPTQKCQKSIGNSENSGISHQRSVPTNQTLKIAVRKKSGNRAERRSASSRTKNASFRLCFFQERRIAHIAKRDARKFRGNEKGQGLLSVVDHMRRKQRTLYYSWVSTSDWVGRVQQPPNQTLIKFKLFSEYTRACGACMMHM